MKPKVLMVDIGGWGGITHYTYNLMQALVQDAHVDCTLLTDQNYELNSLQRNFEVIRQPLNGQPYKTAVRRIRDVIAGVKPDLVHVQTMITARKDWLWFWLGRSAGLKIVLTAHNVLPHEDKEKQAFFVKSALRIIYGCSRKIIVHSQYSKERLASLFKVEAAKIAVIPHGNYLFLRTDKLSKQDACQKLGLPADKKILIHCGALRKYKGIDLLLKALRLIRQKHRDVIVVLAGKAMHVEEGYFRGLIDAAGVGEAVIVRDEYIATDQIQTYFDAADAAVFAYTEIDTSGSIQLAYACAKPVIATRTGSMPEVVQDNMNGMLVEPGNAQALAAACERILFDEDLAARMGERSRALAQERFAWDAIAAQTAQLYRGVTG